MVFRRDNERSRWEAMYMIQMVRWVDMRQRWYRHEAEMVEIV